MPVVGHEEHVLESQIIQTIENQGLAQKLHCENHRVFSHEGLIALLFDIEKQLLGYVGLLHEYSSLF